MNTSSIFAWTALLSFMPVSEIRGGIPFAIASGLPWYWAYPFAVACNALAAPVCWLLLSTTHTGLVCLPWYRKLFERFVERARVKLHRGVNKWGWLGIAVFVAVPLPATGAWTGTLGAWALGISKGKTMIAILLGVLFAGAIVTVIITLGIQVFTPPAGP
ncbi:MAG: small multi-drug export protein [Spirochaetaceae bacterium]|jgi:uncharacterized membrane protein|nr:small multi-drug export protein [Spirochaetaceae bacterium]